MNPEAIEAAAKAIFGIRDDAYDLDEWEDLDSTETELFECQARAALDAAAPFLVREARAGELEAAAEALDVPEFPDRAYYSSGYRKAMSEAQEVLRARAAAIRVDQ